MILGEVAALWLILSGSTCLIMWGRVRRSTAWIIACMLNAVGSFALSQVLPSGTNIRVDLLVTVPLTVAVLMAGVVSLSHRRGPEGDQPGSDAISDQGRRSASSRRPPLH